MTIFESQKMMRPQKENHFGWVDPVGWDGCIPALWWMVTARDMSSDQERLLFDSHIILEGTKTSFCGLVFCSQC